MRSLINTTKTVLKVLIDKSLVSKLAAEAVANCNSDSRIYKTGTVVETEAFELVA